MEEAVNFLFQEDEGEGGGRKKIGGKGRDLRLYELVMIERMYSACLFLI